MWSGLRREKNPNWKAGKPLGSGTATLTFHFNLPFYGAMRLFFFPPVFLCADLLHSPFCEDHFFSFFVNTEEDSHPQAPQFADPSRGQHRLITVPNSLEEDFEHSAWVGMHPFPISYNWADRIHVAQKQGHRVPWVEAQSLEKGVCINVLAFFSSIRGKH